MHRRLPGRILTTRHHHRQEGNTTHMTSIAKREHVIDRPDRSQRVDLTLPGQSLSYLQAEAVATTEVAKRIQDLVGSPLRRIGILTKPVTNATKQRSISHLSLSYRPRTQDV